MNCPACQSSDLQHVLELNDIPTLCNVLWSSSKDAQNAQMGNMHLEVCRNCGLLFNSAFDPTLDSYSPAYDNSLHHSPRFQEFATKLAQRLTERYSLTGRTVVEIGSGSGDFLDSLCDLADCEAIGYDPSHDPSRSLNRQTSRVSIIADFYPVDREIDAALVLCQHVLEHLPRPVKLLEGVRRSMGNRTDVATYFEVPDATYMLEKQAVWDLIYEHTSYFSESTLRYLFERSGFQVSESGRSFGDQYLWIEACPGDQVDRGPNRQDVSRTISLSQEFGDQLRDRVTYWQSKLEELCEQGPVALWGTGSKGVTFLNLVSTAGAIEWVIDINPNKWGKFVPGTGHVVKGPEDLGPEGPTHVLVMNPIYAEEIQNSLTQAGYNALVHVV